MQFGVGLSYPSSLYSGPHHEGIHWSLDVTQHQPRVTSVARFSAGWQALSTEHLSAVHCDLLTVVGGTVSQSHCRS